VPVPPVPEEEEHEVLSVDDQVTVVLALYAIEVEFAETVMLGVFAVFALPDTTLVPPDEPLHAMSAMLTNKMDDNLLIIPKLNDFMIPPSLLLVM